MQATLVPLQEIVLRKGTQTRAEIQSDAVEDYADVYRRDSKLLPPLTLFRLDGELVLVDGFHRHQAATVAGLKSVLCEIRTGTLDDALTFALSSNVEHGIRRTAADKRRAVERCLEAWPKLSDRKAAELCHVEHHLVADVRRLLGELDLNNPTPVNSGIRTTNTSSINRSGGIPTSATPDSQVPNTQRVEIQPSQKKALSTHASNGKVTQELDATGTIIPSDALPFWARRQEVQDIMSDLSRIKSIISKAKADGDPLYGVISNGVIVHLEQAFTHISEAKPYAVCTQCMGSPSFQPTGCGMCGNTGLIGKYKWDHQSRKEVKELRLKSNARRVHAT